MMYFYFWLKKLFEALLINIFKIIKFCLGVHNHSLIRSSGFDFPFKIHCF